MSEKNRYQYSCHHDYLRYTNKQKRKPLRTAQEMADEFGITLASLRGHMSRSNSPKPIMRHIAYRTRKCNSWYDPDEMRSWWRRLNQCQT